MAACALGAGEPRAQPASYTLVEIAPLPPHRGSIANGVGSTGVVVGWSGAQTGYVWRGGLPIALPPLAGGTITSAEGVNGNGAVVGASDSASASDRAALWSPDATGGWTVRSLGAAPGDVFSVAKEITDAGEIAGDSDNGYTTRAVHWAPQPGGAHQLTVLPPRPGQSASYVEGLHPTGDAVAGVSVISSIARATLWTRSDGEWTVRALGGLAGGGGAGATAVNRAGVVAGWAVDASRVEHAVLWRSGQIQDLGTLGGRRTFPLAINSAGDIVGETYSSIGQDRAFVRFAQDGVLRDLNDLVPGTGWRLVAATGINDRGQISGYGVKNGFLQPFLLNPVLITGDPGAPPPLAPSIVVTGGSAVQPILLLASDTPGATAVGTVTLGLAHPIVVGIGRTDGSGEVSFTLRGADGLPSPLLLQTLEPATGRVSAVFGGR